MIQLRLAKAAIEPIVVSAIGRVDVENSTLVLPSQRDKLDLDEGPWDYRCLKGADVILVLRPGVGGRQIEPILLACHPGRMWVWDAVQGRGAAVYRELVDPSAPPRAWRYRPVTSAWTDWENREFAVMLEFPHA